MWRFGLILVGLILSLTGVRAEPPAETRTEVRVGGYEFPPYVMLKDGQPSGLLPDLLAAFNRLQTSHRFTFVETAPKRRYIDFSKGRIDLILFESSQWGWQHTPHLATRVFMHDEEVMVAIAKPERDARFFEQLQARKLVGILGYHYRFAGMDADENRLGKSFDILLSQDHLRNLNLILLDRPEVAEIAIVTHSFLEMFLDRHPEHRPRLMISAPDQIYDLQGLLRPDGPLDLASLEKLLTLAEQDGTLAALRARYRIIDKTAD
ncbi:MAG: transporter substrate-binding domain-containing protein [Gammaproteobacteria bacterium]|nr:transporter substrate-binding domain-containing protein [Gammaproteobacteria bacterium]